MDNQTNGSILLKISLVVKVILVGVMGFVIYRTQLSARDVKENERGLAELQQEVNQLKVLEEGLQAMEQRVTQVEHNLGAMQEEFSTLVANLPAMINGSFIESEKGEELIYVKK